MWVSFFLMGGVLFFCLKNIYIICTAKCPYVALGGFVYVYMKINVGYRYLSFSRSRGTTHPSERGTSVILDLVDI